MATVQVTAQNFEATIERGIVLLDWWAAWCGPCRLFAPIFEAASVRHPEVVFGKVDTEVEQGLAGAFDIRAIPTLMVLRDGVLLASEPGGVSRRQRAVDEAEDPDERRDADHQRDGHEEAGDEASAKPLHHDVSA